MLCTWAITYSNSFLFSLSCFSTTVRPWYAGPRWHWIRGEWRGHISSVEGRCWAQRDLLSLVKHSCTCTDRLGSQWGLGDSWKDFYSTKDLHSVEKEFTMKWSIPVVDPAVCPKQTKHCTHPCFIKDSVGKNIWNVLKSSLYPCRPSPATTFGCYFSISNG